MRNYLIALCVLLFVGCTKADVESVSHENIDSPQFYAEFAKDNTRTFVDENVRLLWHDNDLLTIFISTLNRKYQFDGETGDNSGTFSEIPTQQFSTGNSISANYAVYPYASNNNISNNEVITLSLPSTQQYAKDSFGQNANTMVAVTSGPDDYFLPFKNLCGFLRLSLYGDVAIKSITLQGNNSEKIAGKVTVVAKYGNTPVIEFSEEATESITLDCGEGIKLGTTSTEATDFWIVVPPTTFSKGFTITITDTNGTTITKSTLKNYIVERNVFKSMTAFKVETINANTPQWRVRTIAGEVDEYYTRNFKDGPFNDCGNFHNADNFCVDPLNHNHVWISGDSYGNSYGPTNVRLLNFEDNTVTTLLNDPSWLPEKRIRWVGFTNDGKNNMLLACDKLYITQDGDTYPGIVLLERDQNKEGINAFTKSAENPVILVRSPFVNSVVSHPKSNSLFFNAFLTSSVYKYPDHTKYPELKDDPNGIYHLMNQGKSASQTEHCQLQYSFDCQLQDSFEDRYWELFLHMHPTGNYMINVHVNGTGSLSKSYYNETNDTFENLMPFVGSYTWQGGTNGYKDDIGLNARVCAPRDGVFVFNPDYAGQEDEYDFYFVDSGNHCIRKITPQGIVTTFAGRGTCNDDWNITGDYSSAQGYADGLARGEALFNWPRGITYLESSKSFLVGDFGNMRIREIYFE